MTAKKYLTDYAERAQGFLDEFFEQKIREIRYIGEGTRGSALAVDMLEKYKAFSTGGKKLRGALIQLGFELAGGEKQDVLQASVSIELIHSFLLMHDDIQDLDDLRRGNPTIHKQYEQDHKKKSLKRDTEHFGLAMGINLGDLGAYLGMEVILRSDLPEVNKVAAAIHLSRLLQRVSYGQGLDITLERMEDVDERDVMQVHLNKTGIYTIEGPLKIGGLLGGMNIESTQKIEGYGEPIGIAFQLRDDELGLYSDEGELGKPVGGDVREGKNTLLRVKAMEFSNKKEREFLKKAYGNPKLTKAQLKKVRQITESTGALDYSQKLAKELVKKGKKEIPRLTKSKAKQKLLADFADFVIKRDK